MRTCFWLSIMLTMQGPMYIVNVPLDIGYDKEAGKTVFGKMRFFPVQNPMLCLVPGAAIQIY